MVVRMRKCRWRGDGGRTEIIQFCQGTADVRSGSGRMVVGRPVVSRCPVPGRFRARDEQLGFEVEVAKLVKSERFCGWKWCV